MFYEAQRRTPHHIAVRLFPDSFVRTYKHHQYLRLKPAMNAALAAALPGFPDSFFADESVVNGLWSSILNSTFPATGAPGSFLVCPEMRKGAGVEFSRADLAVVQISDQNPATVKQPALCFEGKSSESGDTWTSVENQIASWTTRAKIGTYGSIWGIGAKGPGFELVALDRKRDDQWRFVSLPVGNDGPTFGKARELYNITDANTVADLQNFLIWIANHPFPKIPFGSVL